MENLNAAGLAQGLLNGKVGNPEDDYKPPS